MIALVPIKSLSQEWRPYVEEGKKWYFQPNFSESLEVKDYVLTISGDTIVDGHACKRLLRHGIPEAFLYEEQRKVYYRLAKDADQWFLAYDFSLMPGDIIIDRIGDEHEVEFVDTVKAKGESFRRIVFKYTRGWQPVWISGIGGRRSLFNPFMNLSGDYCHLVTCKVGDRLLFEGDDFMQGIVSSDPESGIVKIDGLKYRLDDKRYEATVQMENRWNGPLEIPAVLESSGQSYTVTGIRIHAFSGCQTLTRVWLPPTMSFIEGHPFNSCNSLEAIEVAEGNRWLRSADGVLLSADGAQLLCYPSGARVARYVVPEGVQTVADNAFSRNTYLESVVLPNTVKEIQMMAFMNCSSLKTLDLPESVNQLGWKVFSGCSMDTLTIRGIIERSALDDGALLGMDASTVICVQQSEVDKYKEIYKGTVLPLPGEPANIHYPDFRISAKPWHSSTYDLQGRRMTKQPQKGVYIQDGRKVVVK